MGWGSDLMLDIIKEAKDRFHYDDRVKLYDILIPAMQGRGWDCETDCVGVDKAFDEALNDLHPEGFKDAEC